MSKIGKVWKSIIIGLLGASVLQISRASGWLGLKGSASFKDWTIMVVILTIISLIVLYCVKWINMKIASKGGSSSSGASSKKII